MKKHQRRLKARLGRFVHRSRDGDLIWDVRADSKAIYFRRPWARVGDVITVPISDTLDLGMNRSLRVGDEEITLGLSNSGLVFRTAKRADRVIPFPDLLALITGQTLIPYES